MELHEYATMAAFEDFYWWYRGLHGVIADMLRAAGVGEQARILDAGCGTGCNMLNLRHTLGVVPFGFDYSPGAEETAVQSYNCLRRLLDATRH